jgi:hypothetical protein
MTIPQATTAELTAVARDPMQALVFAFEMLTAISEGHSYDALDFMMRRETISVAINRAATKADINPPHRLSH